MEPFIRLRGVAAPLPLPNVDTDRIIPARFLKRSRADGYGSVLFHDLRYDAQGRDRDDFILNREPFRRASILVADDNFGCGSSREAAVYALQDYGIRAIVAPSFGDILYNNCLKNGIVPVRLDQVTVSALLRTLLEGCDNHVTVDLENLLVMLPGGEQKTFDIDPFWQECLIKGIDDLELTLGHERDIDQFEARYYAEQPWAAL